MFKQSCILSIKKERIEKLINSVRKGLPIRIALDGASIPQYYYYSWLKLYNEFIDLKEKEGIKHKDLKELEPEPYYNIDGEVAGYYYTPLSIIEKIKECHALFIEDCHDTVAKGTRDKWQSAAWLLERRCRNEYSKEESSEEKKSVSAVKVSFVDPKQDKKRLEQLLKEVKENVGRE